MEEHRSGFRKILPYLISIGSVLLLVFLSLFFGTFLDAKIIAFLLLVLVSVLAMFYSLFPVLIAATISALSWNFFFIEPKYTFQVRETDDKLFLGMYFVIVLLNGVLTYKIRKAKRHALQIEEEAKAVKLYDTLFNSLSHELKTPIATIIGATDTLKDPEIKLSEVNKMQLIDEISNATLRLNHQVRNLLNMSRLESGYLQLKRDWCDIRELIFEVIQKHETELQTHQVEVNVKDQTPLFKLDYGILEQVLVNLLLNAVHYTPSGSKISVSVISEKIVLQSDTTSKEGTLILMVTDTGKGFPEDQIPFVFNKFYRIDESKAGGTGLGLSIVKGFIEAHQGSIELENAAEGSGAIFTIRIPCETTYITQLKNE